MSLAIEERVHSIIADQLGVAEEAIKPDSEFIGELGADSLDIVELIMAIEEEFEIEIPDEEAEKIRNVSDVVTYLKNHTS
jgi:acyl carrier protein